MDKLNITACYCLVSNDGDTYLEQCLLSIYTLKKHNDMPVKVLVNRQTYDGLSGERARLKEMAEVIPVENGEMSNLSPVEQSRYLKTNLRNLVCGDILFIDTDTIILGSLKPLESLTGDIFMCPENNQTELASGVRSRLAKICKFDRKYFNSRIIFARDNQTTRDFYKKWYENWKWTKMEFNTHRDQEPLAKTNDEPGLIQELPNAYNNMVVFTKSMAGSVITHYFSSRKFFAKEVFEAIKGQNGKVTDANVDEMINCINKEAEDALRRLKWPQKENRITEDINNKPREVIIIQQPPRVQLMPRIVSSINKIKKNHTERKDLSSIKSKLDRIRQVRKMR